jgi:hypothetical protein
MLRSLRRRARSALRTFQKKQYDSRAERFAFDLSFIGAAARFPARVPLHRYMHHYLHHMAPKRLCEHRTWFSQEDRGFGEDAFHAMWFLLMREFRPKTCLEIGVYRGQTVSLWALIANILDFDCEVHGISPFSPAGDAVSTYPDDIDYYTDTLESFVKFSARPPAFLKALSTDPQAADYIRARSWDLIFIDGGHDYDVVLSDYQLARDHLAPGGLLVMDDSSLYTDFRAPLFSFAGHPGPSAVFSNIAIKELQFLGGVGHNNVLRKP